MNKKQISTETLEALRNGDHKAFERVFLAYFSIIRTFVFSYVKSEADAEELTEELFVSLWCNRKAIDTSKSFHAFMHTLARNSAINFLKHKTIHSVYLDSTSTVEESYTSEDDMIARETALLVDMAVEKMPAQRKQVYLLSRKEGLSHEDIAARLNISRRNVESHLSLALKDIRKAILSFLLFIP